MATTQINIKELGLAKNQSKDFIMNILNNQISNYRRLHFAEWVKDNSTPSTMTDKKVAELEAKKKAIEEFFSECSDQASMMDINISIELNAKEGIREMAVA